MVNPDKIFGRLGNRMFQCAFIYSQMLDGKIPDIYVQDPKYFDHHRDAIRRLYSDGIVKLDYVAIHVRRGDYVNNPFYVDLMKTDYYENAIAEFPGVEFLLFSDDIDWCLEQDIFKDMLFNNSNEIDSLNWMSGCKGIIMANSSFSWWASYLSNAEKIIAPSVKNWYQDEQERTVCPKEWIRI